MCWKIFILFLTTIFMFPFPGMARFKDSGIKKKYLYVNSSSLNVRKRPSSKSKIVGKLKRFQKILVIQNSKKSKWVQVLFPVKGYVSKKYLISKKTKTPVAVSKYVKSNSLNVRSKPDLNGKVVGTLGYLQKVQIIPSAEYKLWSEIRSPVKGFVYSSYLIDKRQKDFITKKKSTGYVEKTRKVLYKTIKRPTEVKVGFLMDSINTYSVIALEFKVDLKTSLVVQVGNYTYDYQEGDYEEKASYLLLGVSGRIYSGRRRQGLYLGLGFDVISGKLEINEPTSGGYQYKELEIIGAIPMVSAGFKYKRGRFAIEPCVTVGYITGDIRNNLITGYGFHASFIF